MSRLLVIITLTLCFTNMSFTQNELKQLLRYGDELFEKGDYYYAKVYYEKAMELDNKTLSIQWNYAEILRAYQDYRGASEYYEKVYKKDNGHFYPFCGVHLAQMLQQQGRYDEALDVLEKVLEKNKKNKKSDIYIAANQLHKSCVWAMQQEGIDESWEIGGFEEPINSTHSEFPHAVFQGALLFSSLRTDSIKSSEEVYSTSYRSQIFKAKDKEVMAINDLVNAQFHVGNGSFSLDSSRYYFSMCQDRKLPYSCKIYVARFSNGTFSNVDVLGEIINETGSSATQPAIGLLNGEECLFFASNRAEGKGGMDLYYSIIKKGSQYGKVKSIKSINSDGNEVTPFFDLTSNKLYFSSDFHEGFGGFDIFYSEWNSDNFSDPQNLGLPFNSPENDLYFLQNMDTAYFASNRLGSMYAQNPTCCSDIYWVTKKKDEVEIVDVPKDTLLPPQIVDTTDFFSTIQLPVLYFHNDVPNPRSWAKTTSLDYTTTYDNYVLLRQEYKVNWSKNKQDTLKYTTQIDDLFEAYIDQGVRDLKIFRVWILTRLEEGEQLEVVIRGFASPLTKTEYNVNLTMRRIQSLVNHLEMVNGGVFKPYIDGTAKNGGRLTFERLPFGEYAANQSISDDRLDMQNSVYAPAAALERRIEVEAVRFLSQPDSTAILVFDKSVIDLGITKPAHKIPFEFQISNRSNKPVYIEKIEAPCDCTVLDFTGKVLEVSDKIIISGVYDTRSKTGHRVIPITILLSNGEEFMVYLTTDVRN